MRSTLKVAMTVALTTAFAVCGAVQGAPNATNYFQGWEDSAWVDGLPDWHADAPSSVTRVASGSSGITAAAGAGYGLIGPDAYTQNNGYSAEWGGGWTAAMDVYVDVSKGADAAHWWSVSSAINKNVGGVATHLQDNLFMVAGTGTSGLFTVGARNTYEGDKDSAWIKNYANGSDIQLTESQWLTFQWDYHQDGADEALTYRILDPSGTELWSMAGTSHNLSDCDGMGNPIGGNRYTWFIQIKDQAGASQLAVDNSRVTYVPEPATLGVLLLGLPLLRRRR